MDENTGKSPLVYKSKKAWLESEIGRTLNSVQSFMDEAQTEKLQNGDFLCKHHKLSMRLIHGKTILGADNCILFSTLTLFVLVFICRYA